MGARDGGLEIWEPGRGAVVPDSFTHGSSAQRMRWFNAGFNSGSMQACNTFQTDRL